MDNILLCALTGFGNNAVKAIARTPHQIKAICTRKEPAPYPYYECDEIEVLARQYCIPVFYELPTEEWLKNQQITGLVSCVFHKFIPKNLLDVMDFAINFHPSLLPKYRGASPVFWTIKNGEKQTGWTAHKLAHVVDQGEIYDQIQMPIGLETQGELRQKLSGLLEDFLLSFFSSLEFKLSNGTVQDERVSSSHPRFSSEKFGVIDPSLSATEILQHARALLPWPGINLGGEMVSSIEDLARRINK